MEARGFRDALEQFEALETEVVGISRDRVRAQTGFAEKLGLTYPMLCDENGDVARAYGVRGLLGFSKRVTFLIDRDGVLHKIYDRVSPSRHATEVLEDVRQLSGWPGSDPD